MHQLLTPPQEIRTDRLVLVPVTPADIDGLASLFQHRVDAEHAVQDAIGSRIRHGLGPWVARTIDGGELVGFGGAAMPEHAWVYGARIVDGQPVDGFDDEILAAAHRAVRRLDNSARRLP